MARSAPRRLLAPEVRYCENSTFALTGFCNLFIVVYVYLFMSYIKNKKHAFKFKRTRAQNSFNKKNCLLSSKTCGIFTLPFPKIIPQSVKWDILFIIFTIRIWLLPYKHKKLYCLLLDIRKRIKPFHLSVSPFRLISLILSGLFYFGKSMPNNRLAPPPGVRASPPHSAILYPPLISFEVYSCIRVFCK